MLLTEGDFVDRTRYSNLRETMEALLKLGVLPIVNENDTVSTAELDYLNIRAGERIFSDNDRLAALVMSHVEADALVLLTDVDGLMQLGPSGSIDADAKVIPLIEEITPELKGLALGPSEGGRGGMLTKLEAAEIAMQAGGVAVIANGTKTGRAVENFSRVRLRAQFFFRRLGWRESGAGSHMLRACVGA